MLDVLNKIDLNSKRFGLHRSRLGETTAAANLEVNDRQKYGRCKSVLIYLRYLLNDVTEQGCYRVWVLILLGRANFHIAI